MHACNHFFSSRARAINVNTNSTGVWQRGLQTCLGPLARSPRISTGVWQHECRLVWACWRGAPHSVALACLPSFADGLFSSSLSTSPFPECLAHLRGAPLSFAISSSFVARLRGASHSFALLPCLLAFALSSSLWFRWRVLGSVELSIPLGLIEIGNH